MKRKDVEERTILLALSGSRAYGIANEDSDFDYKGICVAPLKYYTGIFTFEQKDSGWETEEPYLFNFLTKDTVIYELKKYIKLLINNNPNIFELLFCEDYLYLSDAGKILIENREKFFTKKILKSYLGYAYSQLKRMETHIKWIKNPLDKKPVPSDYGLEPNTLASKEEVNRFLEFLWICVKDRIEYLEPEESLRKILFEDIDYKTIFKTYESLEKIIPYAKEYTKIPENYLTYISRALEYRNSLKAYTNYQSWLKNRNPKRAEIERKCGFDGKHAAHCIRLLLQAKEILTNKTLTVNRQTAGDACFLKSIRNGEYQYEEIMPYVNNLFEEVKLIKNDFPEQVDFDFVSEVQMRVMHLYEKSRTS